MLASGPTLFRTLFTSSSGLITPFLRLALEVAVNLPASSSFATLHMQLERLHLLRQGTLTCACAC